MARSLDNYGAAIQRILADHFIPTAGVFETPLVELPLTKAVILLLNLPAQDYLRSQVIDLVSLPDFRMGDDSTPARADLWDLASRELAICKGAAEWRRLRAYAGRDLKISQISDDDEARVLIIPSEQLRRLADTVESLIADLARLPAQGSWREFAGAWKILLHKYLGIAADADARATGAPARLERAISDVLDQLAGLDAIQDIVTLGDFTHTFEHWLERSYVKEDRRNADGVMALNAAGARGLSFRALFVLGMNEGVFPRTIREDAFLRDRDREVLETDLGFKVNPKLAGYDEEKLLFTLLAGAARERFYCSYQRADDNGRALAPSWYIAELERALSAAGQSFENITIPRSLVEKTAVAPFDRQALLRPSELAVRLTLQGEDPTPLVEISAPLPALYRQGRKVVATLDQGSNALLAYDGMLRDFGGYWKYFSERGPAPTALETYARCPFQFFARHVLGLQPLDRPEEILGPSPAEFGELGHEILNGFYRELIERGRFAGDAADIDATLQAVASRAFQRYEKENPVGYPLSWETFKTNVVQLLQEVIAQDSTERA
ncbi:MAG: hypothetical protein FJ143_16745, partial [Deltaproteobacteria bacterium]|nr:hypothetical protein [Deltaproteobacteria bacterium]